MDIYDVDKHRWYQVKRGWFGSLKLEEIVYTRLIRCPVDGDLQFSCGKLAQVKLVEPPNAT